MKKTADSEPRKLTDGYISQLLGVPKDHLPPVVIEAKRAQVMLLRLIKKKSTSRAPRR